MHAGMCGMYLIRTQHTEARRKRRLLEDALSASKDAYRLEETVRKEKAKRGPGGLH